jgi:multidrug efflux system outer membrane protein
MWKEKGVRNSDSPLSRACGRGLGRGNRTAFSNCPGFSDSIPSLSSLSPALSRKRERGGRGIALFAVVLLTACSLAPKFEAPKTEFPSAFKEEGASETGQWTPAEKLSGETRGKWWAIFRDEALDGIENQAVLNSQTLKIAAARVQEARAAARAGTADFLPNINLGANAVRTQPSSVPFALNPYTLYQAQGAASWEPDFFNRVRDADKALKFRAEAQQAAYNDALLALQADVAQTYYSLRSLDAERALLRDTVKVYTESARIMRQRFKAGETTEQDAARADSELSDVQAQLTGLDRRRAGLEHAMAVLLGQMPSSYAFKEAPIKGAPPHIPAGLPSTLLERRPDVAAALDGMQAANANIGAARAAYFPDLMLTVTGGFAGGALNQLFRWSSRTWALGQAGGMALTLPIFDNGRRSGQLDAARARYDEALGAYRQQVLVAFRDVEDNLADQRLLMTQAKQQDDAAASAARAADLVRKRYAVGDIDYSEVVDAERISLAAQRGAVQTRGQRYVTTVGLVRALGGGW